jgi:hypothetical protein
MAAHAMPLHTTVRPATTTAIEMRSRTDLADVVLAGPPDMSLRNAAARCRPLGGIAADPRLQVRQIDECIGLTPQVIGNHRRLARNRGDDGDTNTTALNRRDQRPEISVAGKQYDLVEMTRHLHRVHRKFGVHV